MQIHAIVLAGGDGNRFGGEMPKQFVRLAGDPILLRTLRALGGASVDRVVVVSHPAWIDDTQQLVDAAALPMPVTVVSGGATRNESTRNGLRALEGGDDDIVVVHDAVRPLVPLDVIQRSIEPILSGRAEATDTVIPSADTLVIVEDDLVVEIPDRSRYRRGQTPQTFRKGILAQRVRGGRADRRPVGDRRLQPRPAARARRADRRRRGRRGERQDHDPDRHGHGRPDAPDAGPDADRGCPTPSDSLAGLRVLVIGGTSGIGRAIANEATRRGASAEVDGGTLGLDVRDYASVEARIGAAAERLGGIDHVVCTAGVLRIGSVAETAAEVLADVVDVNLTGTLNVARAAYPFLRRSRGSLTVFTSSSFTRGRPNYVAYSASKAALVNMTQGLSEEWADEGIRVNAVSPERTDTPMRAGRVSGRVPRRAARRRGGRDRDAPAASHRT